LAKANKKSIKKTTKKIVKKSAKKAPKKKVVKKAVKSIKKKSKSKKTVKAKKKLTKKVVKKAVKKVAKTKKKVVEKVAPAIVKKPAKVKKLKPLFNKKGIAPFKIKLLEIRQKISNDVSHLEKDALMNTRDASGDLSNHSMHMADVATDAFDQEMNLGLASSEQGLINSINEALKRIEEGTYGYSVKSGKPISKRRLAAVPYAELTIHEQEEEERLKKLGM
jgi:DnaK suppressor protein